MQNLGKEPYKGVRDFYPEDMGWLKHLYNVCANVANSFGYVEYSASPLEPAELFAAKTGEEIVGEQTYTFEDRGGRMVTLRPEMTPTLSRMIASRKRDLPTPIRWFSFPNLFRYEQPQKGRLREHYQLNVDIFGIKTVEAEIEVIKLGTTILHKLGAKSSDFKILIGNKKLYSAIIENLNLKSESYKLSKLIDKKNKLSKDEFERTLHQLAGEKANALLNLLSQNDLESFISNLPEELQNHESIREIEEVILGLNALGVRNVEFRFDLMRGFDYYTGIIFEFFDTSSENNRSLFGGGRYDELLSIFGEDPLPAVGFGMGDVTARDFLETHNISYKYKNPVDISIITLSDVAPDFVYLLANKLRDNGINTSIDWSDKKVGDKIKSADKQGISYIVCVGEEEIKSNKLTIKELSSGKEVSLELDNIAHFIREERSKSSS